MKTSTKYMLYLLLCSKKRRLSFKDTLEEEERRQRDRRIPRQALQTYRFSTFMYTYLSYNDQALLERYGTRSCILQYKLVALFEPAYFHHTLDENTKSVRRMKLRQGGVPYFTRNREMSACGCGGLGLM